MNHITLSPDDLHAIYLSAFYVATHPANRNFVTCSDEIHTEVYRIAAAFHIELSCEQVADIMANSPYPWRVTD